MNNMKTIPEEVVAILAKLPEDKQKEVMRLIQGIVAGLLMAA